MRYPLVSSGNHLVRNRLLESWRIRGAKLFCASALSALPILSSPAASVIWDGSEGTDWAAGGNWSTGYAPGATAADTALFQGAVTANQPTVTAAAPAGSGSITLLQFDSAGWVIGGAGQTLTIAHNATATRVSSNGAGTNTIAANIRFSSNSYVPTFSVGSGNTLITSGNVTWAGSETSINKSGAGTWTVQGSLKSSGIKVSGGTLELDRAAGFAVLDNVPVTASGSSSVVKWLRSNQLNPGAYLRVDTSGSIDLNGFSQTAAFIQAGLDAANAAGTVSTGEGVLTLSSTSAAGGVIRYGYDGTTLQTNRTGTLALNGNIALNGTGVKYWNIADSTTTAVEVRSNAVISGTGGVVLQGTGTLEMNASNTYSGNTAVDKATIGTTTYNAGTLIANGSATASSSATGTGSVTIGATGTLAGTGTLGQIGRTGATLALGGTDASNLATLAPGNPTLASTVGTLSVNGDVSLGSYSQIKLELRSSGVSDSLALTGALSISGTGSILRIDLLADQTLSGSYTLAAYDSFSGLFSAVYYNGVLIADPMAEGAFGGTHQLIYENDSLLLAVPEPASYFVATMGLALVFFVSRRRSRI